MLQQDNPDTRFSSPVEPSIPGEVHIPTDGRHNMLLALVRQRGEIWRGSATGELPVLYDDCRGKITVSSIVHIYS